MVRSFFLSTSLKVRAAKAPERSPTDRGPNRCLPILAVTLCMAEMVTYLPISSPFIRFAGDYVDQALGFAAGWNFFIFEAALVPFEITACNVIIHYWSSA